MTRDSRWLLTGTMMAGLLGGISLARHDDKGPARPAEGNKQAGADKRAKSSRIKVEKGSIKIDVALKGTVEAEQMSELSIEPVAWTRTLTVKKVVEHGTAVKKGDVLVQIDPEKIDTAIRELRMERSVEELTIRQAREELPVLEKSLPLDLAAAERAKKQADEDLKRFLEVDRALAVADAEQMVKNAAFSLENAREELKQLQKMYRDKDLTEETEEIILKRQRHFVESAEHYLKSAKIRRDETIKIQLPRREQTMRDHAEKEALALEKAKNTLKPALTQKRLALEKLLYQHDKSGDRLRNLEKDRESFTVRAPADGIVYYGKCLRGQWSTTSMAEKSLRPGGSLSSGEVFMTVVSPRSLFIRADVPENDLHWLHDGLTGKVVPAGYPDVRIPARLLKMTFVPRAGGHFDARIALEAGKDSPQLMPGMACSVKLTAYRKKDALTVPASAVFTDDSDDDVHYVYLPSGKNGKAEKRTVKIGKSSGKKTEILEGLKEGEEILSEDPNRTLSSVSSAKAPATEGE
jgi:HlyD family secretion protein